MHECDGWGEKKKVLSKWSSSAQSFGTVFQSFLFYSKNILKTLTKPS